MTWLTDSLLFFADRWILAALLTLLGAYIAALVWPRTRPYAVRFFFVGLALAVGAVVVGVAVWRDVRANRSRRSRQSEAEQSLDEAFRSTANDLQQVYDAIESRRLLEDAEIKRRRLRARGVVYDFDDRVERARQIKDPSERRRALAALVEGS